MREINKIAEGLFEKIRDRFEEVSLGDDNAKATSDPEKARFFNFDYVVDDINHGNITMSLIDETSLKVYFSKNISKDLDKEQKKEWYSFLHELREFARRNLLSFEPRDITRSTLKHRDIAQQSKADSTYDADEVVAESRMYGTLNRSFESFGPVRIKLAHSKPIVDEAHGARSRNIQAIFVENDQGERFRLPFNNLTGARAMARHVSAGGVPTDELGCHITEMVNEMTTLRPFVRGMARRTFEDVVTKEMVESAFGYHGLLKNTLKKLKGKRGYTEFKESFKPALVEDDANVAELKELFVKKTLDERIEQALPLVHKAYNIMKENNNPYAQQFESWATAMSEGSWALPQTDEDKQKLIDLFSEELPVGVDAQNATNALYNIFGDDNLFDALEELAAVDPQADARDTIMDHLQEKNPQMYQSILDAIGDEDTPAEPAETGSEEVAESYTPPVEINGKQVDLRSIELDGVESWDRPDYADAYAGAATFTDGTALTDDELEELTKNHGDIINMKAHDMLEGDEYGAAIPGGTENMLATTNEEKDKISYDPKTGKLTGWEHEGDWKKQTKKKDPVGKIHHMSDVARRRTEKMAKDQVSEDDEDELSNIESIQSAIIRRILNDINQHSELLKKAGPDGVMNAASDVASFHAPMEEIGSSDVSIMVREVYREVGVDYPEDEHSDLHEAFEKALGEAAINVGDIIRDKTKPIIQGKVILDIDEKYIIQSDDEEYHIEKLNAEKVAKEAIEMPDNPDYRGYDKPTFQRKGIAPGQPNKTLPGMNDKKKPGWVGVDTTKPAYQRQADYDQEREQMKKLAGLK